MKEAITSVERNEEEQLSPNEIKIAKLKAQYNNRATATLNSSEQSSDIMRELNEASFNEEAELMALRTKMTRGSEKAGEENLINTLAYLNVGKAANDKINEEEHIWNEKSPYGMAA